MKSSDEITTASKKVISVDFYFHFNKEKREQMIAGLEISFVSYQSSKIITGLTVLSADI